MRWVGLVACIGERRNVYGVLVGKPDGNRPLGRPWHRWGIILKWILNKYDGKTWTGLI
jgi:hypothetical protein